MTKRRFLSNFKHVVDFQFELPPGPRRRRGRQQLPGLRLHPGGEPLPLAVRAEDGPLLLLLAAGEAEEIQPAERVREDHTLIRPGKIVYLICVKMRKF